MLYSSKRYSINVRQPFFLKKMSPDPQRRSFYSYLWSSRSLTSISNMDYDAYSGSDHESRKKTVKIKMLQVDTLTLRT